MVLSYSFYFYTSWNMVMIAILKSLLDMKHLGNLRVGIFIVFFIREFFRLSWFFLYQVNFSAYRRHLEYYMLWVWATNTGLLKSTSFTRFPKESATKDQPEYSCSVLLFKAFDTDGVTAPILSGSSLCKSVLMEAKVDG